MPRKILLADDSVTIQKVIAITFANEDFDLVIAGDGGEAIQKAREFHPDLVMVDVAMPGKNGYDVCSEIKRDPELKGTPVMLLAGTFEPLDADRAASAGADDHIVKPFESQDLLGKVKGLIGKSGGAETAESAPGAAGVAGEPEESGAEAWSAPATDESWGEGDFIDFNEEFGDKSVSAEPTPGSVAAEGLPTFDNAFATEDTGAGEAEFAAPPESDFVDLDFGTEELKAEPGTVAEAAPEPEAVRPEWGADLEPTAPEATAEAEAPEAEEAGPGADEGFFGGSTFGGSFWGSEDEEDVASAETAGAVEEPSAGEPDEEPSFGAGTFGFRGEETSGFEAGSFGVPAEEHVIEATEPEPFVEAAEPESAPAAGFGEATLEAAIPAVEERAAEEVRQRLSSMDLPKEIVEEIVKKVAREVIEEVAWEVVPELAEELINNELVKVREAFAKLKG